MAPHSPSSSGRLSPIALLSVTIASWSLGPLFIKYFTEHYDVWTQNASRYAVAAACLLAFGVATRGRTFRLGRGQWRKVALIVVPNVLMQTCYAGTLYFVYPAVSVLVSRFIVVAAWVMSFALFHDERALARSGRFWIGSALVLAGVATVVWGRDPELLSHVSVSDRDFWIGVALALSFGTFGALYTVTIKHVMRDVEPLAALIALTGVVCIALAHTTYYAALRHIKVVVSVSLMQIIPVATCVASVLWYHERLSGLQMAGGATVLLGAWLAGLAQPPPVVTAPSP